MRKLIIKAFSAFVLLFAITACGSKLSSWKQGPAIDTPHIAATVGTLQLVINQVESEIVYSLKCTNPGRYKLVRVSVKLDSSNDLILWNASSIECADAQTEVTSGLITSAGVLQTGSEILLSLEAEPIDDHVGVRKQESFYMMGTDGQLRQGLGSVFR